MPVRLPLLSFSNSYTYGIHTVNVSLSRQFHTSLRWRSESIDHYSVLGLEPNASQAAIKKQFYSLSKAHHPDHNPNDATASERFVKISEAYAVLGQPEKRSRYDRETRGAGNEIRTGARRGSHSSSAFGSRPASGLSKRRTQFRGPPPSFYKNGGWGPQGTKRQNPADGSAAASGSARTTQNGEAGGGGFGPGQAQAGWDNDVPHFDQAGHRRTQEQQERRRILRRRAEDEGLGYGGASMLIQFFLVGGVLITALSFASLFEQRSIKVTRKDES